MSIIVLAEHLPTFTHLPHIQQNLFANIGFHGNFSVAWFYRLHDSDYLPVVFASLGFDSLSVACINNTSHSLNSFGDKNSLLKLLYIVSANNSSIQSAKSELPHIFHIIRQTILLLLKLCYTAEIHFDHYVFCPIACGFIFCTCNSYDQLRCNIGSIHRWFQKLKLVDKSCWRVIGGDPIGAFDVLLDSLDIYAQHLVTWWMILFIWPMHFLKVLFEWYNYFFRIDLNYMSCFECLKNMFLCTKFILNMLFVFVYKTSHLLSSCT